LQYVLIYRQLKLFVSDYFSITAVSEQILLDKIDLGPIEGEVEVGGGTLSGAQQLLNNPDHVAAVERTAANWLHVIGEDKAILSLFLSVPKVEKLVTFDTNATSDI